MVTGSAVQRILKYFTLESYRGCIRKLMSRLYKELKYRASRRQATQLKVVHETETKRVSKEELRINSKYFKKCSTLFIINEIQIKTTLRFHPILVRGTNNNQF